MDAVLDMAVNNPPPPLFMLFDDECDDEVFPSSRVWPVNDGPTAPNLPSVVPRWVNDGPDAAAAAAANDSAFFVVIMFAAVDIIPPP